MIGILNHGTLLRGLKLFKYQKLASNYKYYPSSYTLCSSNSIPALIPAKEMSGYTKPSSAKAIKLQKFFKIPLNYELIYTSHEYHTIMQHLFTLAPVGVTILGAAQLYINYEDLFPDMFSAAVNLWIVSIFYITCIWSANIGYKTPLRIYHDKETGTYKAIFNNLIPTKYRILEFQKGSVIQMLPDDELTLFKNSRFSIHGRKIYMFIDFFRYPADLYRMFDEEVYQ